METLKDLKLEDSLERRMEEMMDRQLEERKGRAKGMKLEKLLERTTVDNLDEKKVERMGEKKEYSSEGKMVGYSGGDWVERKVSKKVVSWDIHSVLRKDENLAAKKVSKKVSKKVALLVERRASKTVVS
jgi:hypothetical protein